MLRFRAWNVVRVALSALVLVLWAVSPATAAKSKPTAKPKVYTVKQLLDAKPIDTTVVVEGTAAQGPARCTLMRCVDEPCCNHCSARLLLVEGEAQAVLAPSEAVPEVTCSGKECAITCKPLEPGKKYRITGTLNKDLELRVTAFKAL